MFKAIRMAFTCGVTAAAVVGVGGVRSQVPSRAAPAPTQQLKVSKPSDNSSLGTAIKILQRGLADSRNVADPRNRSVTPIPSIIPKCYLGGNYYTGSNSFDVVIDNSKVVKVFKDEAKITDLNGAVILDQSPSILRINVSSQTKHLGGR